MLINFTDLDKKIFTFNITKNLVIEELKSLIQDTTGTHPEHQNLFCEDISLVDGTYLFDYKIIVDKSMIINKKRKN